MIKLLLKNNLSSVFSRLIGGKKGRKGIVAALFVLLMAYVVGVMGWVCYQLFFAFAGPLQEAGLSWLYFSFAFVGAFAVTFILSIFAMKNQLYEAKDNDLLLCLPIQPKTVLASRLISIGLQNFALGLIVVIPAVLAWRKSCGFVLSGAVYMVLLYAAMTFFVLALSALFGWLLSLLTSRMRRKSLFETLFSLAIIVAYFWLYSKAAEIIGAIIQNGDAVAESFGSVAPVYWVGAASADGDLGCFLPALGLFILPYLIVHKILVATFLRTATMKRGSAKIKYRGGPQKASSLNAALLRREARRFFSSSIYTMNAGLGAIFIVAAAVALLLFKDRLMGLIAGFSQIAEITVPVCVLATGFMAGLSAPTGASISIEGKNLWIAQSLPVAPAKLLRTKLEFSLLLYLPALLLNTAVLCILFKPGFAAGALSFVLAAGIAAATSEIGLLANLHFPKLDWQTEAQAVKQGLSVLVSMLVNLGVVFLVGYGGYKLLESDVAALTVLALADAFFVLLSAVLYVRIMGAGAKIYASL